MRAGLLRYPIEFKDLQSTRSQTGAITKEYVSVLVTKANKKRMTVVSDKEGVDASELFEGNIVIIQVRNNPLIKDTQRVIFLGRQYSIKLIDYQLDNTSLITLVKIND